MSLLCTIDGTPATHVNSSVTSDSVTASWSTGDRLFVSALLSGAASITGVTGGGFTWQKATDGTTSARSTNGIALEVWMTTTNAASGATSQTITANYSTTTSSILQCYNIANFISVNKLVVGTDAAGAFTFSSISPSIDDTQVLICSGMQNGGSSFSTPSGFSAIAGSTVGAPGLLFGVLETAQNLAGSYSAPSVGTCNGSGVYALIAIANGNSVPNPPTGLTGVTGQNNQIALSWTAPASGSTPTGYNVKRSTTNGSGYTTLGAGGNISTTTFIDSTASNGTTYYYIVTTLNAFGAESTNSSQFSATPGGGVVPSTPTGLSATINVSNQINLSWSGTLTSYGGGGSNADSWTLKESSVSGSESTYVTGIVTNSYNDTGLQNGLRRYYQVFGVNTYGNSLTTSEVWGVAFNQVRHRGSIQTF